MVSQLRPLIRLSSGRCRQSGASPSCMREGLAHRFQRPDFRPEAEERLEHESQPGGALPAAATGPLRLKNRIVVAPMTRWRYPRRISGSGCRGLLPATRRRRGQLSITEGTTIDHPVSSYSARTPAFHGPALEGWRQVVAGVHQAAGRSYLISGTWEPCAVRATTTPTLSCRTQVPRACSSRGESGSPIPSPPAGSVRSVRKLCPRRAQRP